MARNKIALFKRNREPIAKSYDNSWKMVNGANEAFVEDSRTNVLQDTYGNHPYVNLAVKKIATNINRADFQLIQNDKEVIAGPAFNLFNDVNPYMSKYQLWEASVSWLMIRGEFFLTFEAGYNGISLPKEIYIHNPLCFEHVMDKEKTRIIMWQYKIPGTGAVIPFLPSEILHMKAWNPWNEFRGVNPLISASSILAQDSMIDATNVSLLKNKSTPSGLLTSAEHLSPDQAKEYIERWEKNHGGPSRSGKVAVLGQGLKYQTIGLTPAEMQYIESKKWNRTTILAMYGVPPVVAGYKDENTPLSGTDTSEQLKQFWNITLTPIIRQLEDKLATDVQRRWTPAIEYLFNLSAIPELQDDADKETERMNKQISAGVITINEARTEMGRDPVPWGDTWWKNLVFVDTMAGLIPGAAATEPAAPGKELDIFNVQPRYEQKYKYAQWMQITKQIEQAEDGLRKLLNDILYKQRSEILEGKKPDLTEQREAVKAEVKKYLPVMGDIVTATLPDFIENKTIYIPAGYYDTRAAGISGIVNKIAVIIDGCESADDIRGAYNKAKSVVKDLCRLELMRVLNELRMSVWKLNGYTQHEYVTSMEKTVDYMDGAVTDIGAAFSNGKIVPYGEGLRNFSLPVTSNKKPAVKAIPEDIRNTEYESRYKAMTLNEAEIAKKVTSYWAKIGKTMGPMSQAEMTEFLEVVELGKGLWMDIEAPVLRTFAKGLAAETSPPLVSVGTLTQNYAESRALIIGESGDAARMSMLKDVESGQFTQAELSEKIQHTLGVNKNKADMIAQTESTTAYNTGVQRSLEESDIEYKQWLHAGGGKVDRDHHMIDEIVKVEDDFTLLNGVKMTAPGIGPVDEVVSCHCVMIAARTVEG